MARQKHGFDFELKIIEKYNLKKCKSGSKFDAFTQNDIPVSIKCIKQGSSICLGDFKRNQNVSDDFILVVGFWKDNIVCENKFFIDHKRYTLLCKFIHIEEAVLEMKTINNTQEHDTIWKDFVKKYKDLYPKTNLISINFKRDHKKQKRIQCSISFAKFMKIFLYQFIEIKV